MVVSTSKNGGPGLLKVVHGGMESVNKKPEVEILNEQINPVFEIGSSVPNERALNLPIHPSRWPQVSPFQFFDMRMFAFLLSRS